MRHSKGGRLAERLHKQIELEVKLERKASTEARETEGEYTGLSSSYYVVEVENPTTEEHKPYTAECNDIIEALDMSYAAANIFKAIWRTSAARTLGKTKKGHEAKYDIDKIWFFANRLKKVSDNG